VLLPFIKDGFERGDKAIHVVSPNQHRDPLQRLAGIGIDSTAVPTKWPISNFGAALKPTFRRSVRSGSHLQVVRADGERHAEGGFSP